MKVQVDHFCLAGKVQGMAKNACREARGCPNLDSKARTGPQGSIEEKTRVGAGQRALYPFWPVCNQGVTKGLRPTSYDFFEILHN
jgi:hypothetical protein